MHIYIHFIISNQEMETTQISNYKMINKEVLLSTHRHTDKMESAFIRKD